MTQLAAPEFSRIVPAPKERAKVSIAQEADEQECAALAERFGVLGVKAFSLKASLVSEAGGVSVSGVTSARLVQRCVITLEPIETRLEEAFARRFLPESRIDDSPEFDPEGEDPPEPLMDEIDVGEIAAEAAALAIDPYPRAEGALVERLSATPAGSTPLDDDSVKPFAGLAELKKRMQEDN